MCAVYTHNNIICTAASIYCYCYIIPVTARYTKYTKYTKYIIPRLLYLVDCYYFFYGFVYATECNIIIILSHDCRVAETTHCALYTVFVCYDIVVVIRRLTVI